MPSLPPNNAHPLESSGEPLLPRSLPPSRRQDGIRHPTFLILALTASLACSVSFSEVAAPVTASPHDAAQTPLKPPATPGPIYEVRKNPFRIEVSLEAVLEAEKMTPVSFWPEAWEDLVVLKAVEQGEEVQKGDVLVQIDARKLDEVIDDLESQRALGEATQRLGLAELAAMEKSAPVEVEVAGRARKIAEEDLKTFQDVDRPWEEKWADQRVKWTSQWLEYDLEELRQLEKMYRADELTEETEEIILKRQRNEVERTRFYLESAKVARDQAIHLYLPREDESRKLDSCQQSLAWEKTQNLLPIQIERKRAEVAKLQRDRKKAEERLKKLRKDREALRITAPASGIVFYGPCLRGRWPHVQAMTVKLIPGGRIVPREIFITVVEARPLFARAEIGEADLHHLRTGLEGKAIPTGFPDLKVPAEIDAISSVPEEQGKFDARIFLRLDSNGQKLMPGMTCRIRFAPYVKKEALTVPAAALFPDEIDPETHYVFRAREDGGHEKLKVEVGKRTPEKVEVLRGLSEGDRLLLQNPEQQPETPPKPGSK
ncbi:MAG: hypothetical protein HYU36_12505 [Planctomycetes bacterium]|nr:hypothetical protein [Planctomycetota bacterium]